MGFFDDIITPVERKPAQTTGFFDDILPPPSQRGDNPLPDTRLGFGDVAAGIGSEFAELGRQILPGGEKETVRIDPTLIVLSTIDAALESQGKDPIFKNVRIPIPLPKNLVEGFRRQRKFEDEVIDPVIQKAFENQTDVKEEDLKEAYNFFKKIPFIRDTLPDKFRPEEILTPTRGTLANLPAGLMAATQELFLKPTNILEMTLYGKAIGGIFKAFNKVGKGQQAKKGTKEGILKEIEADTRLAAEVKGELAKVTKTTPQSLNVPEAARQALGLGDLKPLSPIVFPPSIVQKSGGLFDDIVKPPKLTDKIEGLFPAKPPAAKPLPAKPPPAPTTIEKVSPPPDVQQKVSSGALMLDPPKPPQPPGKPPVPIGSPQAPFIDFNIPKETRLQVIQRKLQDNFNRVKVIQSEIKKAGGKVEERQDTYLKHELSPGKIEKRIKELDKAHVQPLINDLIKSKNVSVKDLELFLYAKHAPERNEHIQDINPKFREKGIPGSGMSNETAQEVLNDFKKRGMSAALENLAKRVHAIANERLKLMEKFGLENESTLNLWRKYENYVPLKGFDDPNIQTFPNLGRKGIRGPESKRALGRKTPATNILGNLLADYEATVLRGERNEIFKTFLELVRKFPNKKLWEIDKVTYKPRFDKRSGEVVYGPDKNFRLADNVLSVKENGQEFYITINDPVLASALKGAGMAELSPIIRSIAGANRMIASLATRFSPEFIPTNFLRDIQTAVINLGGEQTKQVIGKVVGDTPKAIRGIWLALNERSGSNEWAKLFDQFELDGGKVGFFNFETPEVKFKKLLKSLELAEGTTKAQIKKIATTTLDYLANINETVENGVRLATYKNLIDIGMPRTQAASWAKNLTVNFNRKGELSNLMGAYQIFFNAQVQGSVRMITALSKSKNIRRIAMSIVVGTAMLAELNRLIGGKAKDGEYNYDKLEPWIKEHNIIIMIPAHLMELVPDKIRNSPFFGFTKKGKGAHFKFPVPYGYNVFKVIGEAPGNITHGKNVMEEVVDMSKGFLNAFNPLGGDASIAQMLTPTITKPIIQAELNQNFFGGPIYPENFPFGHQKPDSQLFFDSATGYSKRVAAMLNTLTGGSEFRKGLIDISPETIDNTVKFYTAGLGSFVMRGLNIVDAMNTGDSVPIQMVPFVRRFVGDIHESKVRNDYYSRFDELRAVEAELKSLMKESPDKGRLFRKNHIKELQLLGKFKATEKKLRSDRKQIKTFKDDKKRVKNKREIMDRLMEQANKAFNEADL